MFSRTESFLGTEARKARRVGPTLRRLGRYFGDYRWSLTLVVALIVFGTLAQTLVPILIGQAVDCFLNPGAAAAQTNCWYTTPDPAASRAELARGLGGLILMIIGLFTVNSVFSGLQFYFMSRAGYHVLRDMRRDVFRHVHRLSLGYFNRQEAGDVMSRFTNDIDTLQQVIGFGLIQVVQGVLFIGMIVAAMFIQSVPFALVSLVTLPLMILATQWLSAQARQAFRQARQEIGSVNANLQENIAAVREVQAFSREDENIEQFETSNAANRDANIRAQAYTSALSPILEALGYVSIAVVAGVGGFAILSGGQFLGTAVSLGLIITFIGFVQQFNWPVQQIALLWTNLQSAVAGAERILDLLDEQPDLEDTPDAIEMPPIRGHVRFESVYAQYVPGEPVLRGVDIEAQPGETIAIVGPTGAGKTTLINLLPRFWDVTGGRVLIDGQDVRSVTRRSLRRQIGLVLQDTFLFSETVRNNIRYSWPEASDQEVIEAAQLARAHEFISRLPEGYDTVLGERGTGLSQGQRQLLALARAAVARPRILILDEATSSVDSRTERQIQEALEQLLRGRTSFVIAHRLSTIRNADQVLFLKDGEVVERGSHMELLARRGHYYELYMSQFEGQEAPQTEASPGD